MKPIPEIVTEIADRYGINPSEMTGRDRSRDVYVARSHAIFFSFQHGHKPADIREYFRRDRTSMHASLGAHLVHFRNGWTQGSAL